MEFSSVMSIIAADPEAVFLYSCANLTGRPAAVVPGCGRRANNRWVGRRKNRVSPFPRNQPATGGHPRRDDLPNGPRHATPAPYCPPAHPGRRRCRWPLVHTQV